MKTRNVGNLLLYNFFQWKDLHGCPALQSYRVARTMSILGAIYDQQTSTYRIESTCQILSYYIYPLKI